MLKAHTETVAQFRRERPLTSASNKPLAVILPDIAVQIFPEVPNDVFVVDVILEADSEDGGAFVFEAQSSSIMEINKQRPTPQCLLDLVKKSFKQMNAEFIRQGQQLQFEYSDDVLYIGEDGPTKEADILECLEDEIKRVYG